MFDILVLSDTFELVGIIDKYISFIWTDRFAEAGDFEIYLDPTEENVRLTKEGSYIRIKQSNKMMIIERSGINHDLEEGDKMVISGRSLESILDRRIIWGLKEISGNIQNGIKTLITEAIISPSIAARKIDNFVFNDSSDSAITSLSFEQTVQYYGQSLYDVITGICDENHIGYKIIPDENNNFVFSLYKGDDHTGTQTNLDKVVFSDSFDNIITFDYAKNIAEYKNVVLVTGEGAGTNKRQVIVGTESGLNRREMYEDAGSKVTKTVGGSSLSNTNYDKRLLEHGKDTLNKNKAKEECEVEIDPETGYEINVDYFIGDKISVEYKYGISEVAKITEIIYCHDEEGYKVYPTLKILINGEE